MERAGTDSVDATKKAKLAVVPLWRCGRDHGSLEQLRRQVERGLDVNATEVDYASGHRPLSWAALHGRLAVVRYLVSVGADVNAVDFAGNTHLHYGCRCRNGQRLVEIVRFLVNSGANVDFANNHGTTPLHNAACFGSNEIVVSLIDSNARINMAKRNGGCTPLSSALRRKDDDENRRAIFTTLVKADAKAPASYLERVIDAPTRMVLEKLVHARDLHAIAQEINTATVLPTVLGELVTEYAMAWGWEENACRLTF
jgi:ankyrin repeat protein